MQHIIDITGSTTAWLVVLFRLGTVLRKERRNSRLMNAWLFALCFALFDTFQIDAVYLAFDRLVSVNNLSWLFSYIFLILVIHYISIMCHPKVTHWAPKLLFGTMGLIIVTFVLGPGSSPERTYNVVPRSIPEVLYMMLCYAYAIVMLFAGPIRAFFKAWCREEITPVRLRTFVALLSVGMASAFFLGKFAVAFLSFAVPVFQPVAPLGNTLASLPTFGLVILWPLCYAPHWFYSALSKPLTYWQNILTVRDLRWLSHQLENVHPISTHSSPPHWLDLVRNPDFYIYQAVIEILDKKRTLSIVFEQANVPPSLTSEESKLGNALDGSLREFARLHQILQGISNSENFDYLLDSCIAVSKQMRSIR